MMVLDAIIRDDSDRPASFLQTVYAIGFSLLIGRMINIHIFSLQ